MSKILKVGDIELDIGQDVALPQQTWREHLWLASMPGHTFVGLSEGQQFLSSNKLHHAAEYLAQYHFEPVRSNNGAHGVQVSSRPRSLLTWDCFGEYPSIELQNISYIMRIAEQPTSIRESFFEQYQGLHDPAKIVAPKIVVP